jgi:hypothetical protein
MNDNPTVYTVLYQRPPPARCDLIVAFETEERAMAEIKRVNDGGTVWGEKVKASYNGPHKKYLMT